MVVPLVDSILCMVITAFMNVLIEILHAENLKKIDNLRLVLIMLLHIFVSLLTLD